MSMEKKNVSDNIREKVRVLMNARGTTKTRLGEILGDSGKVESSSQKFQRANRFFKGDGEIKVDVLTKLACFFERSVDFFLEDDDGNVVTDYCLRSSDRGSDISGKPLDEVERGLRKMGFDDDFIRNKLVELRAIEAYGFCSGGAVDSKQ